MQNKDEPEKNPVFKEMAIEHVHVHTHIRPPNTSEICQMPGESSMHILMRV